MDVRSRLVGPAGIALVALCGCSDDRSDPAYVEKVGYRADGELVVYTPAGISFHDAKLRESGAISLDRSVGGALKDEPVQFTVAENGRVAAVGFSNTSDRDVEVYDLVTQEPLLQLDLDGDPTAELEVPVQHLRLSPDGKLLFVGTRAWGVYDVESGERLWGVAESETCCQTGSAPSFSRDGQVLFSIDGQRAEQFVARQARTGELLYSVDEGATGRVFSRSLTSSGVDGILLEARISWPQAQEGEDEQQSYIFRSERDGSVVSELPQFAGRSFNSDLGRRTPVACTASGELCATGLTGLTGRERLNGETPVGYVEIWRRDGTLLHELGATSTALAFSPDGSQLAIGDGQAKLYRVEDGALLGEASYTYQSY